MYTGARIYQEITINASDVSGVFGIGVRLSDLSDDWWAQCAGATNIVFTDASDTPLKKFIDSIDTTAKTGMAWVSVSLSSLATTTIRVQTGGTVNVANDATLWSDLNIHARYSFDDANDSAGNYNLTNSNVTFESGKIGNAAKFDSSLNAKLTNANIANFERTQAFTLMVWVKRATGAWGGLFDRFASTRGIAVFLSPANAAYLQLYSSGSNYLSARTSVSLSDNQWAHLAMSYKGDSDANNVNLYVNSTAAEKVVDANTLTNTILNEGIGEIGGNVASGVYYNGLYDEFRIYETELSAQQISTIYKIQNHDTTAFYTAGDVVIPRRAGGLCAILNLTTLQNL
jgi:hypothetical protein